MVRSQEEFSWGPIGRLAEAAGVGVETIRFYQRQGLLPVPAPSPNGKVRQYDVSALRRLRFIRNGQAAGFTLAEINELLRLDSTQERTRIRSLAQARLTDLQRREKALRKLIATMRTLVHHCEHMPEDVPCPIVEAIGADPPIPRRGSGNGGKGLRARSSSC